MTDNLQKIAEDMQHQGREMRLQHIRETARDEMAMKVLFALMCPPLALFPAFWRS